MTKKLISWLLRITAAVILLQTLYFKFTAHPDSVAIFTELEMEPYGRILIGVFELLAAILLLVPWSVAYGALLGMGLMAGAIMGHITKLGFEGDRLSLSMLAVLVLGCSMATLYQHRKQIPFIQRLLGAGS